MGQTNISKLAETIFRNVKVVDSYLKANNLPSPSFDVDGPTVMEVGADGEHVEQAKIEALEAAMELVDLLAGPLTALRPLVWIPSLYVAQRKYGRAAVIHPKY